MMRRNPFKPCGKRDRHRVNLWPVLAAFLILATPVFATEPSAPKPAATPPAANALEAYRHRCMQSLGQRWKRMVDETEDRSVFRGSVKIQFQVLPEGRPKHIEVLEQTEDAAAIRRTALFAAGTSRFEPIPAEALKLLGGKPLKIQAKFSLKPK